MKVVTIMAKYTMELNEVIQELASVGKTLFDIDYNLPDFMNKEELQNQFIFIQELIHLMLITHWNLELILFQMVFGSQMLLVGMIVRQHQ